jgi:hypothetical protein
MATHKPFDCGVAAPSTYACYSTIAELLAGSENSYVSSCIQKFLLQKLSVRISSSRDMIQRDDALMSSFQYEVTISRLNSRHKRGVAYIRKRKTQLPYLWSAFRKKKNRIIQVRLY